MLVFIFYLSPHMSQTYVVVVVDDIYLELPMSKIASSLSIWGLFFLTSSSYYITISQASSSVHIVYLGKKVHHDPLLTTKSHLQLLSSVFQSEGEAKRAIVYSYRHSFSGFSATINTTQASILSNMEGVISVFRSKILHPHTTRSWDFMGLTIDDYGQDYSSSQLKYGSDVVVGIFDTGVWPESKSFKEPLGIGPIPKSWKGKCVAGDAFDPRKACNRKLIGAKYYINGFEREFGPLNTSGDGSSEYRSPRDRLGHGTHTASTAVGALVRNASFFGFGSGVARGGSPMSRLAVYKICWFKDLQGSCTEADILAAYDDALNDGVNVISSSLGRSPPLMQFFSSNSDIGSFHATLKGVTTVYSAGNDGPELSLVQNVSPWGICVAAATIDRSFPTEIILGNNVSIMGESFIIQQMEMKLADSSKYFEDGVCDFQKWKGVFATGTIVLCFSTVGSASTALASIAVFAINGSAMIFAEPLTQKAAQDDLFPSVHVDMFYGTQILYYIQSSKNPTVKISRAKTIVGQTPAPAVAYFSSRGPNTATPSILKPDLAAPGVNILAAWPSRSSPTTLPIDGRSVDWNFDSGTSMSCPHVAGVVALLKSAHPDWSPAAIRSALMTTAYTKDTSGDGILSRSTMKTSDPFDMGAGHMNPIGAFDPGLVYDSDTIDYLYFLCTLNYTTTQISQLIPPQSNTTITCPKHPIPTHHDLNYPAIVVPNLKSTTKITRTLTNVGAQKEVVYHVTHIVSPNGVMVVIRPMVLVFGCGVEKLTFQVWLTPTKWSSERFDFGEFVWSDGKHRVRSPIVVSVGYNGGWGGVVRSF